MNIRLWVHFILSILFQKSLPFKNLSGVGTLIEQAQKYSTAVARIFFGKCRGTMQLFDNRMALLTKSTRIPVGFRVLAQNCLDVYYLAIFKAIQCFS